MTEAEELNHYNQVYATSKEYKKNPNQSIYFSMWKDILSAIDDHEEIVELGCGSGQLANILLSNNKKYLFGIDYSHEAIKLAKYINSENHDLFFVRNIYDIKPGEIKADVVICTEVIEHLDNDSHVFEILSPGTRVLFSVPDFWYKTHKRIFKNMDEIKDRYKKIQVFGHKEFITKNRNKIFLVNSQIK